MTDLDRRRLLGLVGAGGAAVAGGYWLRHDQGPDCPAYLEPAQEYRAAGFQDRWTAPVEHDGTTFLGTGAGILSTSSGRLSCRLFALDSRGEPKWVIRRELGGGMGVPTPTEARVFASTGGNILLALERETGRTVWEADVGNHESGHMSMFTGVHDDLVLTTVAAPDHDAIDGEAAVVGFSVEDGTVEWAVSLDHEGGYEPRLVNNTLLVLTDSGEIRGFTPETGELRWETVVDETNWQSTPPVSFAGSVWEARGDGTLFVIDPETGAKTDQIELETDDAETDGPTHAAVHAVHATDEMLLLGGGDGTVRALDADGAEHWKNTDLSVVAAMETYAETVGVLDQRGVYAELDAESGETIREFLFVDVVEEDRCGYRPDEYRYRGLTATSSFVITAGERIATKRYTLPPQ